MGKNLIRLIITLIITAGVVWLAIKLSQGHWLMGWDNLLIELNPRLGLERSFFGAWQSYYGLGTPSLMAQASDLPRAIIYCVLSPLVPAYLMRWLLILSMWVLGFLGTSKVLRSAVLSEKQSGMGWLAWLGAIFYLISFGTIQTFRLPFEPFAIFYAFLPWSFWLTVNYLKNGKKRDCFGLLLIMFFGSCSFYVQTIFIVYGLLVGWYLVTWFINHHSRQAIRRVVIVLALIGLGNAYWLGPVGYSTITNAKVVVDSKQNQLATPENDLSNQARGSLVDVALLRGFWVDFVTTSNAGKPELLMADWKNVMEKQSVVNIGLIIFGLILFGSLARLDHNRLQLHILGIGWLAMVFVALGRQIGGFKEIFDWLSAHIPLFNQVFRAPFTKWSVAATFIYAWGLTQGLANTGVVGKKLRTVLLMGGLIPVVWWTVLMGGAIKDFGLFDRKVVVSLPQEYLALNSYLKTVPNDRRIAQLPINLSWGWSQYSWNYRGSGFLWYGIEQPILDRAFDVWSPYNEGFYLETKRVVDGCLTLQVGSQADIQHKQCVEDIQKILSKYRVSYVLIDRSMVALEGNQDNLKFDENEKLLSDMGAIKSWSQGNLALWKIPDVNLTQTHQPINHIVVPISYSLIEAQTAKVREDVVFADNGYYASGQTADAKTYPFAGILQERVGDISYDHSKVLIHQDVQGGGEIVVPGLAAGMNYPATVRATYQNSRVQLEIEPLITLVTNGLENTLNETPVVEFVLSQKPNQVAVAVDGKVVVIGQNMQQEVGPISFVVGKAIPIKIYSLDDGTLIDIKREFMDAGTNQCWLREGTQGKINMQRLGEQMAITVQDASDCMSFNLNRSNSGALLKISLPYQSDNEARPHFCVVQEGPNHQCVNEEVFYQTPPSLVWAKVERWVPMDAGINYWMDIVARSPDEPGKSWTINYQVPSIATYPLLMQGTINPEVWYPLMHNNTFSLSPGINAISLAVASTPISVDLANSAQEAVKNCDLFKRGSVEKLVGNGQVDYRAQDRGAACDYAVLKDIAITNGYILRFKGENKSGRSLKFYLFNTANNHNDLEELLPTGVFDESYAVLAWPWLADTGYTLNLENRSFGPELSENIINKVEMYPVPLSLIARIQVHEFQEKGFGDIIDTTATMSGELTGKVNNLLQISNVSIFGTSQYAAEVTGSGLLALAQGYEAGWLGIQNNRLLNHVKVNGWSNGWLVPGSGKVTIFYWPQYLEWLGLGALGVSGCVILGLWTIGKWRIGRSGRN